MKCHSCNNGTTGPDAAAAALVLLYYMEISDLLFIKCHNIEIFINAAQWFCNIIVWLKMVQVTNKHVSPSIKAVSQIHMKIIISKKFIHSKIQLDYHQYN